MILIFGGTTEGRLAVKVADEAGTPYFYSTRGEGQSLECRHGERLQGAMDAEAMITFCKEQAVRLLVDAAHPFAERLHTTIHEVATTLQLPVVRLERRYAPHDTTMTWCDSYNEVMERLEAVGTTKVLLLTGVQTLAKLRPFWSQHIPTVWARVLDREVSRTLAKEVGFPEEHLIYYKEKGPFDPNDAVDLKLQSEADETTLFQQLPIEAIVTKESGESGGFVEKCKAAQQLGLKVYVVKRPVLPTATETVTGAFGLRKAIERLVPGFFPLRSGYTTGSCATAAAKAALWKLLSGDELQECPIELPDGEVVKLPVSSVVLEGSRAIATVIKDAGDDPDVTNGCTIGAKVWFANEESLSEALQEKSRAAGIRFLQGEGVGTVTLPGIGLPIGEPAINPVPRQMIIRELTALYEGHLNVKIFVPEGRELAQRTFNPKLGIVDGISILGTSGIVLPFSSEAFIEAIQREVEVSKAIGAPRLVINSGAKSEAYVKQVYPSLPPQAFVHYGNFIGETLKVAASLEISAVTMGIMLGKAVKLAEGFLDTHSKKTVMNKVFLQALAQEAGCSPQAQTTIAGLTLARELWTLLTPSDQSRFFPLLLNRCHAACTPVYSKGSLTILLIDEEGNIPYRI